MSKILKPSGGRRRLGSSHRPCLMWWWIIWCGCGWIWLSKFRQTNRRDWTQCGDMLDNLYANNIMVRAWDSEKLHNALKFLISLFRWYGISPNVTKSQTITYQPGALWSVMSEEEVGWRCMGLGVSYCEQLQRRIPWPECGVEITTGSMSAHRRKINETEPVIYWNQLPVSNTEHLPEVYDVSFPKGKTQWPCLFPGCPRSSQTLNSLLNHLNQKH